MTQASDDKGEGDIELLRNFLLRPDDRAAFNDFYKFCHKLAVGSLGYLQRRGYRLPIGIHNSISNISDMAIDILGPFFRVEKGVKYGVIFNYLAKEGLSNVEDAEPFLLMSKFRALLLGHVRNELFRLTQQDYPEAADLKKRFNKILASEKYLELTSSGGTSLICLSSAAATIDVNLSLMPQEPFERLVEEAYLATNTISDWCSKVFELLLQQDKYSQAIPRYRLIAAAVKVSGNFLEIEAVTPTALPTPEQLMLSSQLENLCSEVLEAITKDVIQRFLAQGRIDQATAANFAHAVESYLADMSNGDQVDQLPDYFREVMPPEEHRRYLNHYKYVFETIINKAREELIDRVKKFL